MAIFGKIAQQKIYYALLQKSIKHTLDTNIIPELTFWSYYFNSMQACPTKVN